MPAIFTATYDLDRHLLAQQGLPFQSQPKNASQNRERRRLVADTKRIRAAVAEAIQADAAIREDGAVLMLLLTEAFVVRPVLRLKPELAKSLEADLRADVRKIIEAAKPGKDGQKDARDLLTGLAAVWSDLRVARPELWEKDGKLSDGFRAQFNNLTDILIECGAATGSPSNYGVGSRNEQASAVKFRRDLLSSIEEAERLELIPAGAKWREDAKMVLVALAEFLIVRPQFLESERVDVKKAVADLNVDFRAIAAEAKGRAENGEVSGHAAIAGVVAKYATLVSILSVW